MTEQRPGLPIFQHVRNCENQQSAKSGWSFELPDGSAIEGMCDPARRHS
jgi:hypothetical protein